MAAMAVQAQNILLGHRILQEQEKGTRPPGTACQESVMSIRVEWMLPLLAAFLLLGAPQSAAGQADEPTPPAEATDIEATDVNVVNTPVRIPWTAKWNITASGFNKSMEVLTYPDEFPDEGYIAVVETISYRVEVPTGQNINLRFCFDGGDIGPFTLYPPHVSPWPMGSTDVYADTIQVRVYAGGGDLAGNAMKAYLARNSNYGHVDFTVNAMGYFLPQDSPTLAP
jgi:hypothetical protein